MSNNLVLKPQTEIAKKTKGLLCAVKYFKNKKRNFESVTSLSRLADLYVEKDEQYLVGFGRSKEQANIAMATLEEMRVQNWDYILFANGRVQLKKHPFKNMLDCYNVGASAKDPTKHCLAMFDSPVHFLKSNGQSLTVRIFEPEPSELMRWTIPCKKLEGFIRVTRDELSELKSVIEISAIERSVGSCPLFDINKFKVEPIPKSVDKPKTYWD